MDEERAEEEVMEEGVVDEMEDEMEGVEEMAEEVGVRAEGELEMLLRGRISLHEILNSDQFCYTFELVITLVNKQCSFKFVLDLVGSFSFKYRLTCRSTVV